MNVKLISYSQAPQDWDYGDQFLYPASDFLIVLTFGFSLI